MIRSEYQPSRLSLSTPTPSEILITGVSPFEDLPGYQYYSLLLNDSRFNVVLADDNDPALTILRTTGTKIHRLAHPGTNRDQFLSEVTSIAQQLETRLIVPGTDSHLFALADASTHHSWLRSCCPPAAWLADRGIKDKCHLQQWISDFLPIPKFVRSSAQDIRGKMNGLGQLPIMVKGLHKGAVKCEAIDDLESATRAVLRNPANAIHGEQIYLEECIEGEEHCLLVLRNNSRHPWTVGLRKLATTQTGTTLAAVVEHNSLSSSIVEDIANQLSPGMAIELEWRGSGENSKVFEVNCRFPSWIGALGKYGHDLLVASLDLQVGSAPAALCASPESGSVIYRLPQSGFLSPDVAFYHARNPTPLLWASASPHQFLVK